MSLNNIPISADAEIHINHVLGDLRIKGWEELSLAIKANPDDLRVESHENIFSMSCTGDCSLDIPQKAKVIIESVHGDAHLMYLAAPVTIQSVFGSLSLRNLGGAHLGIIHGDLSAKHLQGKLEAVRVNGDAYLREIRGDCAIEKVSGNFDLRNLEGELQAAVKGNGRLRMSRLPAKNYKFQTDGNLHCHIPEEADLALQLSSKAQVIRIKLPHESKTVQESYTELTIGSGEKTMVLEAGGVLYLYCQSVDWGESDFGYDASLPEDLGQQIAQQVQSQIESQIETINRQVNEQISQLTEQVARSSLPPDQVELIIDHARQVSDREAARSQERLRRTQEKLERKLEAAQRRQDFSQRSRKEQTWNFNFSPKSRTSAPPEDTVSDDERLMILRMLEQKKISLEEADRLLSALEGK